MGDKGEDRLSQLPSSVALYILSFLSMKDAARTSALSRYWRRRWLFADLFYFDTNRVFNDPDSSKCVEWVNNVLRCHRDATDDEGNPLVLNKLRIYTLFQQLPEDQLDEWLSYAFACRVQSLELDCFTWSLRCPFSGTFPDGTDFNCLRSLSLASVNVTEQVIESFLSKFPFLERLKLCADHSLKSLTVCGSSLALKHLELSYCYLDLLVVRNTSLVSLSVNSMGKLVLINNPKLVAVRAVLWRSISNILEHLSGCLPTVQILALDTTYKDNLEAIDKVPQPSEVKQLTLIIDPLQEDSLIRLAALLSLSPKLEKLVLEFLYVYGSYPEKKMALSTVSTTKS